MPMVATSRRRAKRGATRKQVIVHESESTIETHFSSDDGDDNDVKYLDSDALDEEYDDPGKQESQRERTRVLSPAKLKPKSAGKRTSQSLSKQGASNKRPMRKKRKVEEDEDEEGSDFQLKDGQEVVGRVVQAPKTGWVPEGQISQHTLDFLTYMQDPACNDRVWFKLHEPIYRQSEKEFKNFVEALTTMLTEVDPQIPPLPPKDVIHRIYRDIRFSNDKTPYKRGLSASFSRSGRKGIYAFCEYLVKPGNESALSAGAWCPAKNELTAIRNHISHSSDRLREIISGPEFVSYFGEPRPHPKGKRQNVFGADDELKTAPKGIDKNHKDIDLLRCRSLAVSQTFTDDQVLNPMFVQDIEKVVRVLQPFIHCLNDMITLPAGSDDDEGDDDIHE
ncbi:hypothetical protein PAXRUDRAFT_834605 [Paxillus rubicundulus Ve08.2h10]|uniref:Uncharacterized protein n=1 Tax=Paxillus rubicundulus Ve08.2h10 TaxID=930991 RepID=A0A0D0DCC6_9AGAM|nr:hypothetical protein PAXRUDRAFT_834605 [Paxillus rubicundulus Ve08.2h10]